MLHVAHISCHLSSLSALSSSLSIVFPSSILSSCLFPSQELPGFHAYEVHPFKRREVRPGTEQPSLWHNPRSHPLLHHTQTPHPGCRAPLAAVPCAGADALTDLDPLLDLQTWTVVDTYSKSKMFDRVECHFLYFWGLDYLWCTFAKSLEEELFKWIAWTLGHCWSKGPNSGHLKSSRRLNKAQRKSVVLGESLYSVLNVLVLHFADFNSNHCCFTKTPHLIITVGEKNSCPYSADF